MLIDSDLSALWLTLKLATITTLVLLVIATPLSWWLSQSRWRFKFLIEAVVALPLVLPPTVLGFYLLIFLGPQGPFKGVLELFGQQSLAFSFTGLVIGSVIYSLPFVVQPLQSTFSMIGKRPLEAAATLGATPLERFCTIVLPLARPGFLTASILGFAHTLGEFGVVLMIGGNIPDSTKVASIAIYDHVESMQYAQAHTLSAILLLLSFVLLVIAYSVNWRFNRVLG